ncbi:MAG: hypothetical protein IPM56_09580 [Ignavibacteriales bacterium]|nr:MAG: hypothetical protein IPM56_09580 [Ignavibacteriales bacterium]
MKYASTVILAAVVIFFIIWWNQNENQSLRDENKRLKSEIAELTRDLDEFRYSPTLLLKQAKSYFNSGEYFKAKENLGVLIHKHPNSREAGEGKYLMQRVENMIESIKENVEVTKPVEPETKPEKTETKYSIEAMHSSYDVNEKVTYYRDRTVPRYANENGFFLYFRKYKDKPRASDLLLRIQNISTKLLNIHTYNFKVDDRIYKISPQKVYIDSSSGQYWEWCEMPLNQENYTVIDHIINSGSAKFRIEGRTGYKDNTIDADDKRALKNTLEAFKSLGGIVNY